MEQWQQAIRAEIVERFEEFQALGDAGPTVAQVSRFGEAVATEVAPTLRAGGFDPEPGAAEIAAVSRVCELMQAAHMYAETAQRDFLQEFARAPEYHAAIVRHVEQLDDLSRAALVRVFSHSGLLQPEPAPSLWRRVMGWLSR
jgi:hypothetical protein